MKPKYESQQGLQEGGVYGEKNVNHSSPYKNMADLHWKIVTDSHRLNLNNIQTWDYILATWVSNSLNNKCALLHTFTL